MNKINELLDKEAVKKLFKKELSVLYPNFKDVIDLEIIEHKKNIWLTTYHIVFEFKTTFLDNENKINTLPIYCTAHSSEPRKNVYDSLKFLWEAGFSQGDLSIPHALFYSEYYNATFYRGVEGCNLYKFIRENQKAKVEVIIPKVAAWFVKLHQTPVDRAPNFNEANSRIRTVYPGFEHILARVKNDHPQYANFYETIYNRLIKREEDFLATTTKRWLVHGDAHPENVIKMSAKKIAVIDFTDLCLSDFARDLGSFLQQTEYMIGRKLNDAPFAAKIKNLFLDNYLRAMEINLDDGLKWRIETYYYWTAMRTATYFLLKSGPDPERARLIIEKLGADMRVKVY